MTVGLIQEQFLWTSFNWWSPDANVNSKLRQDIESRSAAIDKDLQEYAKTQLDPYEGEKLKVLHENLRKYREGQKSVIELALQNKNTEAYQLYLHSVDGYAEKFNQDLVDLAKYNAKVADELNRQNKIYEASAYKIFVGVYQIYI